MLTLLLIFLLLLGLWAIAWRRSPKFAFGIFLGVGIAWIAVTLAKPYLTGREEVPIWLPPLPVITVALVLFVLGITVWFRGSEGLPVPPPPEDEDTHH
jgi:hypothetical protein